MKDTHLVGRGGTNHESGRMVRDDVVLEEESTATKPTVPSAAHIGRARIARWSSTPKGPEEKVAIPCRPTNASCTF